MFLAKRSWSSSALDKCRNYEFYLVVTEEEAKGLTFSSEKPLSEERKGFVIKKVAYLYAPEGLFPEIPELNL